MKILTIGLIAFVCWSLFSTYFYVCKIKGFCTEVVLQSDSVCHKVITVGDSTKSIIKCEAISASINNVFYFEFDDFSFHSSPETDNQYLKMEFYLQNNPNSIVSITGHTDNVGTAEYNEELGFRRTQTIRHYFESRGLLPSKIRNVSKGETEPLDSNSTSTGRANNRRAEITIK